MMMSSLEIFVLAVALAMDCFTVAVVSGVLLKRPEWRVMARFSLLFGLFQAGMPLVGWLLAEHFSHYIEDYDHWIAFVLLAVLGGKMIVESFREKELHAFNPVKLSTQTALALATSIDALAVGISLACVGYATPASLLFPLITIGMVSSGLGMVGFLLGIRFGVQVSKRMKPALLGGVILIIIGVKILLSHLYGL